MTALLATACGGESNGAGGDKTAPEGAGRTTAPSTAAPVAIMPLTATEMEFSLPHQTMDSGAYRFVLTNAGRASHAVSIKGPGIATATSKTVEGGEKTELTVNLRPGRYELWCPVGDHRELGMVSGLVVR